MKWFMSNKAYDIIRIIGNIVLPALATLYGTLSGIWGLPYGEQIVASLSAVALFLNALLKISADNYWTAQAKETTDADDNT